MATTLLRASAGTSSAVTHLSETILILKTIMLMMWWDASSSSPTVRLDTTPHWRTETLIYQSRGVLNTACLTNTMKKMLMLNQKKTNNAF